MNNSGKANVKQIILIILMIIIMAMICTLVVLKIKDNNKKQDIDNDKPIIKDNNNYVELVNLTEELKKFKEIKYNEKTVIEDVTLYGLESLKINKIAIENGKIKYYAEDDKVYIDNSLSSYTAKYIEYTNHCDKYSEILVSTSNGLYYFNTNGNPEIVDETAKKTYYGNKKEFADYIIKDNNLSLNYTRVSSSSKATGISTVKHVDGKDTCSYNYLIVNSSNGPLILNYTKEKKNGLNIISSLKVGDSLYNNIDYISYLNKGEYPLYINYDLSIKNSENEVIKDIEENKITVDKIFSTKDAYYIVSNNKNVYKLLFSDPKIVLEKHNTKEIEKIDLEEEKTYQGETITSIKQYIKIIYTDGTKEEIL